MQKTNQDFKKNLKDIGDIGLLTCYRITPFLILLNREAGALKYNMACQAITSGSLDVFDISTSNNKQFKIDEWGNILKNELDEETQKVVAKDLSAFKKYMVTSIFRTIAFKSCLYKELNLSPQEYFDVIITPMFLELYNFYGIEPKKILKKLSEMKIEKKKFFGKKEVEIKTKESKNALTISADDVSVEIPKIRIDRDIFTKDYKRKCLLLNEVDKYWVANNNMPVKFLLDPFNFGQTFQFFSQYLEENAKLGLEKSKISVQKSKIEGEDELVFKLGTNLCAAMFSEYVEEYKKKFG